MAERKEEEQQPSFTKMNWLQGGLYTLIGTLSPIAAAILGKEELTTRFLVGTILGALVSGSVALKAYLSNSKTTT